MAKSKTKHLSYISVPSQIIPALSYSTLQSLVVSPKKLSSSSSSSSSRFRINRIVSSSPRILLLLLALAFLGTLRVGLRLGPVIPCAQVGVRPSSSSLAVASSSSSFPAVSSSSSSSSPAAEGEFWRQPDGMGYRPCLGFSEEYRRESPDGRRKYLLVVVAGGLNQQRNQIVDAVVIARILGAALVVPILQVNVVWGDESEFSDIFDLEHFKKVLADDVRVVSSLPSTHIMTRPVVEKRTPLHVSPRWIRARYLKKLTKEGVLLLRGLDSRLSKDLPPDLQKLRCKVAFQALRFAAPIADMGNKLAMTMRSKGPYLALHLRMEKDVWVRTGCLPGLSAESDRIIQEERTLRPELLTGRSNMSYHDRKLAGLCPLNTLEVARLLKALEAPRNTRMYWAGGEPFGGSAALEPLTREFPHFYSKENISLPGELEPFANKSSLMAAIDYIVCEQSDVFMPSHGGNMGHLMQGHRAFAGHKKFITPNKRQMLTYFLDASLPESEFNRVVKSLHLGSMGGPEHRTDKVGKDVTAFPVPECMCNGTVAASSA